MTDYTQHYLRVEGGLRQILDQLAGGLPAAAAEEVGGFMAVREYGLALEALVAGLCEPGARADGQALRSIDSLAQSMGIASDAVFCALRDKVPRPDAVLAQR